MAEKVMEQTRDKIYFISDAHLGSGNDSRQREKELCSWLERIQEDCGRLFLLGDMFDFWFTYRHVVPRGHVRLLGKLAEMADRGVEIHFFIGNHDMWVFDYLTQECGIIVHDDPEVFQFGTRRFLIGHGDGLGHLDHKFDLLRRIFRSRLNQRLFAMLPSSWTFPIARHWSDSNKRKHEREDCLHYLGDEREGIVLYSQERLKKDHFDFCIFGHRHTPLMRKIGERCLYVNTGDWMINRNYAVYDPSADKLVLYGEAGGISLADSSIGEG